MSTDERVRLGVLQGRSRECWITMWHNAALNVDVLIGAGTKEACMRVFEQMSGGVKCNENLVYSAVVTVDEGQIS